MGKTTAYAHGAFVLSASHPMLDLRNALVALRETTMRLAYWRAKDKVRAAGEALVRSSDRTYDERNARHLDAKKRVRFLRAELLAAGVRP